MCAQQRSYQQVPLRRARRRSDGGLESGHVPGGAVVTPFVSDLSLGEDPKEHLVALVPTLVLGLVEDAVGDVHRRQGCLGVQFADVLDVATQDLLLHRGLADEVERHQKELPTVDPLGVLRDDRAQLRNRACSRIALQQQVKDGHHRRLAGAEAGVQVGGLGPMIGDRGRDQ